MQNLKMIYTGFMAAFCALFLMAACTPVPLEETPSSPQPYTSEPQQTQLLGGDRDEHGCIGSAGYSWCEARNKCLRIWEEPCEAPAQTAPTQEMNTTQPARPSPAEPASPNLFTTDKVKIGDKIAGLEIVSLGPANPKFSALSDENAVVSFRGEITINGTWHHDTEESMLGERVCIIPDEDSRKLLPAIAGNERDGLFCFTGNLTNMEKAVTEFAPTGASGTGKIIISDFTYYSYPSEGTNTAILVKVIEKTTTPATPPAPSQDDEALIKNTFSDIRNKTIDDITLKNLQITGNFARGSVSFTPGGEGASGLFLAFKQDNAWKIVFEGNGAADCYAAEQYGFPSAMLEGICY